MATLKGGNGRRRDQP